jgi:hypothetical protein
MNTSEMEKIITQVWFQWSYKIIKLFLYWLHANWFSIKT